MKQLTKLLHNAGFVVIADDNSLLVGHYGRPITFGELLEAIYPECIDNGLYDHVVKSGAVRIFRRNDRPGRTPRSNGDKMFRPQIGPALDKKAQEVQEWFEGFSPEGRMMQLIYRKEDYDNDQLRALQGVADNE